MPRNMLIMIVASLGFFFVTATTFTSLGYVLYTMVRDLGWSQAAAGLSFSCLGLACGLSSPLPPLLMKIVGTRLTMALGGLVLAAGFLLAATIHGIGFFFVATTLMGVGFSLIAPSPGVYLLATWFPKTSARMIGFYFMAGSFGGVAGPLIVGAIVSASGSWRLHWLIMAACAFGIGLLCLFGIRDAVAVESIHQVKNAGVADRPTPQPAPWTVRHAMMSRSFILVAVAMTVIQTAATTMHSVLVTHVASLGSGSGAGAVAMSLLALTGTLAKGATGALTERINPKHILVAGLALQGGAMALLSVATSALGAYAFALVFGLGWGLGWLSAHVLLLRYFGATIAGEMVAMATLTTTFAVLGPLSAGWIADDTGSFISVFLGFAILLAAVAASTALLLRPPPSRALRTEPAAPDEQPHGATLVAAE